MNRIVKFCKAFTFAASLLLGLRAGAFAVQIEGFTSGGNFKTVSITNEGYLLVANISSGTATSVVFVSSQPVNAFQATSPWIVKDYTYTTPQSAQASCASNSQIVTASGSRVSTLICNTDSTNTAFVGPTGVTTGNGAAIFPKQCFSPDTPGTFTGSLFCSASPTVTVTVYQGSP